MYHQLQKIGEEGITAEIDYTLDDPEEDRPVITKIKIGDAVVPVGAFDLPQIEHMEYKLPLGHGDVMRELIGEAKIDRFIDSQY